MEDKKQKEIMYLKVFLESLGIKINENTRETPERMFKAWSEMCRGIGKEKEIRMLLLCDFPSTYTGMVTQGPIEVFSLCSHHMLPIEYKIFIGYIPNKKRVIGFSKTSKAIALLSAKPANQEDLTQEISDTFIKSLDPEGFGIVILGKHHCMVCRGNGVHNSNSVNITSVFRRSFRKFNATREEFYKNLEIAGFKK